MVARIRSGKNLKGAVNYNEQKVKMGKAELIGAKGYPKAESKLNFHDKLNRLQKLADLNTRAETNCLHVSLNFDPTEKIEKEKLINIAAAYMEGIGFKDQPYLVYQHHDAAHPHMHIVSTTIQKDGKRISIHNLGRHQSEKTRKEIEVKFGLIKASDRHCKQLQSLKPVNIEKAVYGRSETKRAISNIVTQVIAQYKFASLPEFNAVLQQYSVMADRGAEGTRMHRNNGLLYGLLNEKGEKVGVPIKASNIYGSPTLKNLAIKFAANKKLKQIHKNSVKKLIAEYIQNSSSLQSFITQMKAGNMDVILRRNDQNFLYGITYVEHKCKCVFNGSELGKEFSAAVLREKWEPQGTRSGAAEEKKVPINTQENFHAMQPENKTILEELTGSSSGFNNQLPYPFRKRKKRKNRKL